MNRDRKSCRQQNIPKRTIKRNEGALRPRMAAALLLVLFREIWGWDHNPKQLNNQQRGQHRRLGNAHGARDDLVEASCVSFASAQARKRKKQTEWLSFCACAEAKDTQFVSTQDRLPWLGLKAVKTLSTSCESCQALSALFPIAGARAANTAETISKEWSVYVRKQKILLHEAQGKFLHQ